MSSVFEKHIQFVFRMIDEQINLSVKNGKPLPFYDLNEMIKLEYENCKSPLRLSIKFKNESNKYGHECDISGNYFAMLWMYKNRKQLAINKTKTNDKILVTQFELYGLWLEDYIELEEIDMNNITSIDAYIISKRTGDIHPLKF